MKTRWVLLLVAAVVSASAMAENGPPAEDALPNRIQGDLGILADEEQSPVRGEGTHVLPLPFAFADYGRLYARIDTFGVKTARVGYGYLEIAGRVKFDGYSATGNAALTGIAGRRNSVPIGLGTFQETPIGGFFIYALHDIARSQGNLVELTYAAELKLGEATLYPEAGFEHYTSQYTQYYYGVSPAESASSGYAAYRPGAVTNPFLCLFLEVPITPRWNANFFLRRKWLGAAMANSPLVDTRHPDAGFAALTVHFQ